MKPAPLLSRPSPSTSPETPPADASAPRRAATHPSDTPPAPSASRIPDKYRPPGDTLSSRHPTRKTRGPATIWRGVDIGSHKSTPMRCPPTIAGFPAQVCSFKHQPLREAIDHPPRPTLSARTDAVTFPWISTSAARSRRHPHARRARHPAHQRRLDLQRQPRRALPLPHARHRPAPDDLRRRKPSRRPLDRPRQRHHPRARCPHAGQYRVTLRAENALGSAESSSASSSATRSPSPRPWVGTAGTAGPTPSIRTTHRPSPLPRTYRGQRIAQVHFRHILKLSHLAFRGSAGFFEVS